MTTLEIITSARALIADPRHWLQGAGASDAAGDSVGMGIADAVCFCSLGAMSHIHRFVRNAAAIRAMELLSGEMNGVIAYFNDTKKHGDVMAAFDRAIAAAAVPV